MPPKIFTKTIYSKQKEMPRSYEFWSVCKNKAYGKMIVGAEENCTIGKSHYKCVDISGKLRKEWFCQNCSPHLVDDFFAFEMLHFRFE